MKAKRTQDVPDNFKPLLAADCILAVADRNIIVTSAETGKQWTLNDTAAFILSLCTGARSIREITLAFGAKYDVEDAEAQRDVRSVIRQLCSLQIIEGEYAE